MNKTTAIDCTKLRRLMSEQRQVHKAAIEAADSRRHYGENLGHLQHEINGKERSEGYSQAERADDQKRIENLKVELKALEEELGRSLARFQQISAVAGNCVDYARSLGYFVDTNACSVQPPRGMSISDSPEVSEKVAPKNHAAQIERVRKRIADVQSELEELSRSRLTEDATAKRLAAWVNKRADDVDQGFDRLVASAATLSPGSALADESLKYRSHIDLMCWMDREAMITRMREKLSAMAETVCANENPDDRAKLRDEKQMQLDELESREEQLIVATQAAGLDIPRRVDARPEIILGATPLDAPNPTEKEQDDVSLEVSA